MTSPETHTSTSKLPTAYAHDLGNIALPDCKLPLLVEPARPDYRTSRVEEAFPWVDIIDQALARKNFDPSHTFFLVVFTSQQRNDADPIAISRLHELDEKASQAAGESPALEHYYAGEVDTSDKRARSFCLWSDPMAARIVSEDKYHQEAMTMISEYESYDATRYILGRTPDGVSFYNLQTHEASLVLPLSEEIVA